MVQSFRLLPFRSADGASNMAADEVLLAAAERGVASLRFYTWTAPTVSLGYFQSLGDVRSLELPIPQVRRSTGGAAIVHHHELTYALALPAGKDWQSPESWICRFHRLLGDMLENTGIKSHVVGCGEEKKLGEVLCFLHQTPGDLLIGGSKVAGSAQRKRRGALLQHGSLLLRRSEHAAMLPGINDAAGREIFTAESLAQLLVQRVESMCGWTASPADWTAEERELRRLFRDNKYGCADWNSKR